MFHRTPVGAAPPRSSVGQAPTDGFRLWCCLPECAPYHRPHAWPSPSILWFIREAITVVGNVRKPGTGDGFSETAPPLSPFRQRRRIGAVRAIDILQPRSGDTNRGTGRCVDPSPPLTFTSFSHFLFRPFRGCGLGCLLGPGAYAPGYCGSPLPGLESVIAHSRNRRRSRGSTRRGVTSSPFHVRISRTNPNSARRGPTILDRLRDSAVYCPCDGSKTLAFRRNL